MRLGLLSTARINRKLLEGARASDEIEVVAVASRDEQRASAYAAEHGIPRAHGSYEDLLADPDVEAVYVSLPNSMHVPWAIRALEAGKHVLCEKPLARAPADVERAFDAAQRAGRVLMEAFMWRHHPQAVRLRELVAGGAIGRLRLVRARFGFRLEDGTDVRLAPELAGGALMDVGCYCVSGARLLAGEPIEATAQQVLSERGVDVALAGALRFDDGVLAQVDCFFVAPYQAGLEAVGEEGSILLRDPWHGVEPGLELSRNGSIERIEVERSNSYRLELEDLAAAVRGERAPRLGRADALGQARAIDALYRAAEEGARTALG